MGRDLEVDCAFGEVFVRVFHLEERIQSVKHDEMMSSLFVRLGQMDHMLDMISDGAIADIDMKSRVTEIISQVCTLTA